MVQSRTMREGLVGLFALGGLLLFSVVTIWLRGGGFGQKDYQVTVTFPDVSGLQVGSLVRYRGVNIGRIVALVPGTNEVKAVLSITSPDLQIPRDVTITTNRSGLIGETTVDIIPLSPLPAAAKTISPLGKDCDPKVMICNKDTLKGTATQDLMAQLSRLVNVADKRLGEAVEKVDEVSKALVSLSKSTEKNINQLSKEVTTTSRSLNRAANDTSQLVRQVNQVVAENRGDLRETTRSISQLTANVNGLIQENRSTIQETIVNLNQSSKEVTQVLNNLNGTLANIDNVFNSANTTAIVKDIEVIIADTRQTTENLKNISATLNDPKILLTVQETLDAARVTFQNAQKITSDIDEFTGDPQFRQNLRRLVDGLTDLVSSTEYLEGQIKLANNLDTIKIELNRSLAVTSALSSYQTTPVTEKNRSSKKIKILKKPTSKTKADAEN